MRTAILGARVIDPASGLDQVSDLYIDGGKLVATGQAPTGFVADQTLDVQGLIAAPGLVDLSVALREPGYSRKGSIATETLAAAAGGVTSLCCPPFTKPVLDTSAVAELILDRAREAGHTKVFPIGALSKGLPASSWPNWSPCAMPAAWPSATAWTTSAAAAPCAARWNMRPPSTCR